MAFDPVSILAYIKAANMAVVGIQAGVTFVVQQMRILREQGGISDELFQQILAEANISDDKIDRIHAEALAALNTENNTA